MNAVNSKVFKSGNSVAVRLPKAIAFPPDTEVVIERKGDALIVRRARDPVAQKRKVLEFVGALRALGPVGEVEKREPIEFPDRPGLY